MHTRASSSHKGLVVGNGSLNGLIQSGGHKGTQILGNRTTQIC
ncbi:MAG: hypothetical protein ACT6RN_27625 [Agrobacterium sp.]